MDKEVEKKLKELRVSNTKEQIIEYMAEQIKNTLYRDGCEISNQAQGYLLDSAASIYNGLKERGFVLLDEDQSRPEFATYAGECRPDCHMAEQLNMVRHNWRKVKEEDDNNQG
jgi:hypothetical protein